MANIARTVNVLQAMILTGRHRPARRAAVARYVFGQEKIPMVSASATRAADGSAVHLSLANTSPAQAVTLSLPAKSVVVLALR